MIHYYQQCQECGENAFEYKRKPKVGQPIFADDIVGENIRPCDEIICSQCQMVVPLCDLTIKNVIEVEK